MHAIRHTNHTIYTSKRFTNLPVCISTSVCMKKAFRWYFQWKFTVLSKREKNWSSKLQNQRFSKFKGSILRFFLRFFFFTFFLFFFMHYYNLRDIESILCMCVRDFKWWQMGSSRLETYQKNQCNSQKNWCKCDVEWKFTLSSKREKNWNSKLQNQRFSKFKRSILRSILRFFLNFFLILFYALL